MNVKNVKLMKEELKMKNKSERRDFLRMKNQRKILLC
jgi:hypothetical protein